MAKLRLGQVLGLAAAAVPAMGAEVEPHDLYELMQLGQSAYFAKIEESTADNRFVVAAMRRTPAVAGAAEPKMVTVFAFDCRPPLRVALLAMQTTVDGEARTFMADGTAGVQHLNLPKLHYAEFDAWLREAQAEVAKSNPQPVTASLSMPEPAKALGIFACSAAAKPNSERHALAERMFEYGYAGDTTELRCSYGVGSDAKKVALVRFSDRRGWVQWNGIWLQDSEVQPVSLDFWPTGKAGSRATIDRFTGRMSLTVPDGYSEDVGTCAKADMSKRQF